jgi:hypothetical protein
VAETTTHLIVTNEGEQGFFAESPQLPGLAFGRPTQTEFLRDYKKLLDDLGVTGSVRGHKQVRGATPDGHEFLLRWAEGDHAAERLEVVDRLRRLVMDEAAREDLFDDMEPNPMGEVVFVAVAAVDTLGDVMDQMYEERDAIVLSAAVADRGVWCMQMVSRAGGREGWSSVEERGWTRDTTISEVLVAQQTSQGDRDPAAEGVQLVKDRLVLAV